MQWREISLPALGNVLSTGAGQPLAPQQWPTWAQKTPDFAAAWFTPTGKPLSTSTGNLTTSGAQAYVEMERVEPGSTAPLRYYGYFYCRMTDGRTFQYGPIKDGLGHEHHEAQRASRLESYKSTST